MPARRNLLPALAAALSLLAAAPAARADFFSGDVIDGPSADIRSVGDVDVARDGSAAVAYLKQDEGATHAFVARLVNGRWQAPERMDAGLPAAASQPVVAVSDGGRVIVAYINGGTLYASVKPAGDQPFLVPQALATGAVNPSIDMSINGGAYISFTVGGDVRVARVDRKDTSFHVLDQALDVDQSRDAGDGTGRSQVAVSADGTAVVVWGEANHVYSRRVFFDEVSDAPQDLNVPNLGDHAGFDADSPDIDIEDDSSYAWVVYREKFDDGAYHVLARRLAGSEYGDPAQVDGIPFGSGDSAATTTVDLNGRGEGLALTGTQQRGVASALIHDDHFFDPVILNPGNAIAPQPFGGRDEVDDAFAFWLGGDSPGDAVVHGLDYQIKPNLRTVPGPGPDNVLSDLSQGAVDVNAGFDGGVNRAGDAIAVYVQDGAGGRRLMSSGFDRPPGTFRGYSGAQYRNYKRAQLVWGPSFELWGPVTYTVKIDGQPVGQTQDRRFTPTTVADGTHKWQVTATDFRGQSTSMPTKTMRADATPPALKVSLKRRGGVVTVSTRAADGSLTKPAGSGLKSVQIDFGDGTKVMARKASHHYRGGRTRTLRVTATDKAGNATTVTRRVKG